MLEGVGCRVAARGRERARKKKALLFSPQNNVARAQGSHWVVTHMRAQPCCGRTRAGRPCSLTSASALTDEKGRRVASPLRKGGDRCRFHSRPFDAGTRLKTLGCVISTATRGRERAR